ncbi:hypothetical protein SAY86_013295 [Trapa natans]|uniref:Uncharacterized protein n=1 Tax=Trapa natans TaxID=22666 RepID=A0AAN7RCG1_TRANT|nr:hypothetical protein SAY86_013295 [Trapa natans]
MALFSLIYEVFQRPTISGVVGELVMLMVPVWIAVIVGILVGWAWKPKWAYLGKELLDGSIESRQVFPSSHSASKSSILSFNPMKLQFPSYIPWISDDGAKEDFSVPPTAFSESSSVLQERDASSLVMDDDLQHLWRLVEVKDGGPAWIQMMERSTSTMSYKAWRRDPEVSNLQSIKFSVYSGKLIN